MITTWIVLMHPRGFVASAGKSRAQAEDRARAMWRRHAGDDIEDGLAAWMSMLSEAQLQLNSPVELDEQIASVIPASLAIIGEDDICRRCGCRDHRPCPQGCGWAEDLLCDVCDEAGEVE